MSNLFMYEDPTLKTTAVLNDAMRNAASIMGLKNQADYQQRHNELMGQHYTNEAINQAAQREIERQKIPVTKQTFSNASVFPFLNNLRQKNLEKHWKPLTDILNQHVANKEMTNEGVYHDISNNFDAIYREPIRQALLETAFNTSPSDPAFKSINKSLQDIEEISGADVAKMILPTVHREIENSKSAVEAQKSAERAAMLNPETQAYRAFYSQAKRQGMNDEDAAVAATEKFGVWKSKMNLEGKYPPINVSVKNPYTPTTMVDDQNRPLKFNKSTGKYEVQEGVTVGAKPTTVKESPSERRRRERRERAGIGTGSYKSADEVKAAYQAGKLTREQALSILKSQFGMQ